MTAISSRAIRIDATGGPETMQLRQIEVPAPGPGELRIRHHAVGLNYIDVYFRTGLYPMALPEQYKTAIKVMGMMGGNTGDAETRARRRDPSGRRAEFAGFWRA